MFRSRVFLVSLLAFPLSSLSFKIDDSCEKKGLTTLVRDGMNGAFEMVDSALNRLNKSPYDEETSNYIRWLFLPKEGQDPNDRQKMEKLRLVFNNIRVRYRQETHVPNDQVPANDVIVYCDESRFKDNGETTLKGEKLFLDESTGRTVRYSELECHGDMGSRIALAVADNASREFLVTMPDGSQVSASANVATRIQLCPWFLDWIKNKNYRLGNEVARSNIGRTVVAMSGSLLNWPLTQIDAFALLDKVLLHEMTHGRGAFQKGRAHIGGLKDLKVPPHSFWSPLNKVARPGYGWEAAKSLAKRGVSVDGDEWGEDEAPDNNADSLAMFASAARLLDDKVPRRVTENGRIEKINK